MGCRWSLGLFSPNVVCQGVPRIGCSFAWQAYQTSSLRGYGIAEVKPLDFNLYRYS